MFGVRPKTTLNGLVTVSPFLMFTKYAAAPAGAADCPESACAAGAGCWARAGTMAAAIIATVRMPWRNLNIVASRKKDLGDGIRGSFRQNLIWTCVGIGCLSSRQSDPGVTNCRPGASQGSP